MSRLSHVPTNHWPDTLYQFVQADAATNIELGLTRMLAHAPEAALGALQFGAAVVMNRTLPERMMELMRLRIALIINAEAVWRSDINRRLLSHLKI